MAETVDLPVEMEPVRPIRSIVCVVFGGRDGDVDGDVEMSR